MDTDCKTFCCIGTQWSFESPFKRDTDDEEVFSWDEVDCFELDELFGAYGVLSLLGIRLPRFGLVDGETITFALSFGSGNSS